MKPEAQRIAIANACGLKDVRMSWHWQHGDRLVHGNDTLVPNYLTDLNAMHEAEETLGDNIDIWIRYDKYLAEGATKFVWHATAAQRAEAFLRTLNLWTS